MTGAGIVLPVEDELEIERRFADLEEELAPKSAEQAAYVKRFAMMTVRLDRCAVHEAKATSFRMRHAIEEFDEKIQAEVDHAYSWIATEPATYARRLRKTPQGIDKLLANFEAMLEELNHPEGSAWDWHHCEHVHHMIGRRWLEVPVTRIRALSEAMGGDFKYLRPDDAPELTGMARQSWAVRMMIKILEEEVEALKKLKASLDLEALELDRSEAGFRAMFDPSPAATLARKYEAAAERGLYRSIKELRASQALNALPDPRTQQQSFQEVEETGSFLPAPPDPSEEEDEIEEPAPISAENRSGRIESDPISVLEGGSEPPDPVE